MNLQSATTMHRISPDMPRRRWWLEIPLILGAFVLELVLVALPPTVLLTRFGDDGAPRWVVVLILVAEGLLLLVRRTHPLAVLVAILGISTGLILWLDEVQPFFYLPIALFAVAAYTSRRTSLVALGLSLAYVPVMLWSVFGYTTSAESLLAWLPALVFFVLVLTAVWAIGRRDHAQRAGSATMRDELVARVERAAHEERQRIARELHDIVAHSVSAMMMQAAGARAMTQSVSRDLPDDGRVRAVEGALGTIEGTGAQSMRELHRLLGALREGGVDALASSLDLDQDLSPSSQPGLDDLDQLVETPRRSGLIVEVHRSGPTLAVDPSVGNAAYRVVQESLTNALKHAGRGAVVDVYLAWQEQELQVQVRSRAGRDAVRPDTPHGGTGLRGLRERVNLVGGSFESGWAGEEFVTTATLPVRPSTSDGDPATHTVERTEWE